MKGGVPEEVILLPGGMWAAGSGGLRELFQGLPRGERSGGSPRAPRRGDGEGSSGSVSGSAGGESVMKSRWMRKVVVTGTLLLSLLAAGGCRQQEPPRGTGGEAINLNALNEIQNYKEILRKDPNNLQALINIGNLYYDTGQDLIAIEHYQRALSLDPRNVNVRTDMAVCYRRKGNPDKAIEELKEAISIDPRHTQSRYNLGVILIHDKNDIEGGIAAWEALLTNVPDYPYRDSLKSEITKMRATVEAMKPKMK